MAGQRADTCWVTRPDQLAALTSARRHDIVDRLAAGGPVRVTATLIAARQSALPSALCNQGDCHPNCAFCSNLMNIMNLPKTLDSRIVRAL